MTFLHLKPIDSLFSQLQILGHCVPPATESGYIPGLKVLSEGGIGVSCEEYKRKKERSTTLEAEALRKQFQQMQLIVQGALGNFLNPDVPGGPGAKQGEQGEDPHVQDCDIIESDSPTTDKGPGASSPSVHRKGSFDQFDSIQVQTKAAEGTHSSEPPADPPTGTSEVQIKIIGDGPVSLSRNSSLDKKVKPEEPPPVEKKRLPPMGDGSYSGAFDLRPVVKGQLAALAPYDREYLRALNTLFAGQAGSQLAQLPLNQCYQRLAGEPLPAEWGVLGGIFGRCCGLFKPSPVSDGVGFDIDDIKLPKVELPGLESEKTEKKDEETKEVEVPDSPGSASEAASPGSLSSPTKKKKKKSKSSPKKTSSDDSEGEKTDEEEKEKNGKPRCRKFSTKHKIATCIYCRTWVRDECYYREECRLAGIELKEASAAGG